MANLGDPNRVVANVKLSRFRKRYRELSATEIKYNDLIKDTYAKIEFLIDSLGNSRETNIALTNLETSAMYAIKALTGHHSIADNILEQAMHDVKNITAD